MFLNPVMLAGTGAAMVPLVLHFLSRSRFRTVDWGGMMFLEESARRISGAGVRQWTLLLLRMGIVGLLAVALARPVVAGWWGRGTQRRLMVLVMDCSGSMAVEEAGGRSRMELAKEEALRVLSGAHVGDRAALVELGTREAGAAGVEDVRQVASRVAELTSASGVADVAGGLLKAAEICEQAEREGGVSEEIYVIGDRQARSWEGVGDVFAASWQTRWGMSKGGRARVYAMPVGSEGMVENVGVESVEVTDRPVVRGQPVGVEVRVHNYGGQVRTGVPVGVLVEGRAAFEATVNIEAGGVETVRTMVKFAESGRRAVSAEVKGGDLPWDNRLELGVDVREPLNVMVIGGGEGRQRDSMFLQLAVAPFAGQGGSNLGKVTLARDADANISLAGADVVVLANAGHLAEGVVGRIEQFVYAGGGLIIAPGSASMAAEYTRLLYRNGAGVMPAALRAARGEAEAGTTLLGLTLDHPVFRFLKGMASPVPSVSVSRYFPADPREGDSRVLGSYASGDPFLVEGTFGAGRVLLVTTPLDAEWSDLPLTNFYLPFVQSCVRYVAKGGGGETFKAAGSGESDLTPLGEESWERLRHSLGMEELSATGNSGEAGFLSVLGTFENELWLPLMGGVIGLMLVESLLGRAWSEGGAA